MSEPRSEIESIEVLADSFLERLRRGERPDLEEYAARHPELAGRIRDLFPALIAMEACGPGAFETGRGAGAPVPRHEEMPELLGDFRILREVGRGGMGIVYEAVQESLGRHVALKVLPTRSLTTPTQRERFHREASAAARLHHTNIVPVFGVGDCAGVEYYAMQFIQGLGLDEVLSELRRLRAGGPMPPLPASPPGPDAGVAATVARALVSGNFAPEPDGEPATGEDVGAGATTAQASGPEQPPLPIPGRPRGSSIDPANSSQWSGQSGAPYYRSVASVGVQVAEALDHAHSQGILHRDIKPSNLLLDTRGTVWVTDFGLAKAEGSDDLTRTGDIVGTLRYMAPERFEGQSDALGDIYSLGLTLYELLTTRPAFGDSDRAHLIQRIRSSEPTPPRQIDKAIPRDLETIVLKAIAREPSHRYATAGALAEDLKRFLGDRVIRARRVGFAEHAWRWCRRNPALAGAVGAAAAALVAVAVIAILYADTQRQFGDAQLVANKSQLATNKQITGLAKDLTKALAASNRTLAIRNYDRGRTAFEKEEIGEGLHWMIESWRSAVEAGDPALQRAARVNISAWRPSYRRLKGVLSHGGPISSVAFSPDGKAVATGSDDKTARLWDPATSRPIGEPMAHPGSVTSVAFSPVDKTILTGCFDGTARLWDAATGRAVGPTFRHDRSVTTVAFSRDGKLVLTGGSDKTARLWDAATGRAIHPPLPQPGAVMTVAFSPDGKALFAATDVYTAVIWDVATGRPVGLPLQAYTGFFLCGTFSPDSKTLLTGRFGGVSDRWDTATGRPIGGPTKRHDIAISAVAFSPDGKALLTGSKDGMAKVWDATTDQILGPPLRHQGTILFGTRFAPVLDSPQELSKWQSDDRNERTEQPHLRTFFGDAGCFGRCCGWSIDCTMSAPNATAPATASSSMIITSSHS